jgi:Rrf2 family transcriptional regulator, iron-sulfur cluster assembly transcription factor
MCIQLMLCKRRRINPESDENHVSPFLQKIDLSLIAGDMFFSKSFGYAVRGVLYIVFMQDTKQYVQAEEIAQKLVVPRHFVSKILKKLVKSGVLSSSKGKAGGFTVNERTREFLLVQLFELTDGMDTFNKCSLRLQDCNELNPCPLHLQLNNIKQDLRRTLSVTTIGDLIKEDKEKFINSIATLIPIAEENEQYENGTGN